MNRCFLTICTVICIVICTAILFPVSLVADEGLISHWSFDNDSAGVIKNDVAEQFSAKAPQELRHIDGVNGKALDLSGKYAIEIPAGFVPSGLKAVTFSAWIKPTNLNGFVSIVRKDDVSGPVQNRLLLAIQNDGQFLTLGLTTGRNYAECDAVMDPKELLDGKWHLVAGTFDGKTMRVYLDGQEIGSCERQSSQIDTAADFRPLKKYWHFESKIVEMPTLDDATVNNPGFLGSCEGASEFYQGGLDEVKFYHRAVSQGELQSEFAKVRPIQNLKASAAGLYYVKDGHFVNTLLATAKKVAAAKEFNPAVTVPLHRFIRSDFPKETNDYIVKFQRSPVDLMTWDFSRLEKRANELKTAYAEYLPITAEQWKYLSKDERAQWETVKANLALLASPTTPGEAGKLYPLVLDMELSVANRPQPERVAPYRTPETPAVKDRTPQEAQAIIEAEWLFQCDHKPTLERIKQEIGYARQLVKRFGLNGAELKQLDALEQQADTSSNWTDKNLYFAVRRLKRDIVFKNPALDFDTLVYVDGPLPEGNEWRHETRHYLGYMGVTGGRLMTLKGLSPDGKQTKLMPSPELHGTFWRPDVSYDAKKILVSFKPHNEKTFHLYETDLDTQQTRQLTAGMFDDFDPIYLPDGKNMMFLTTRGHIYVRCMPPTNAMVMARMSLDGNEKSGLYIISRNGEPEYTPSVMNDGRVIYTRWEYTDKPLWRCQSLWTMNADGTQVQTFWGNQSVWPDLLKDARQIPGSERVMFTGAGHHDWFGGSIGIIDPGKGFNFPDGLTKVTQELPWVESGNGPIDPKESKTYHAAGNYGAYYSPYPLNEKDFLVSAERRLPGQDGKPLPAKWVLLLMDTDGNRELVMEGDKHILDAKPLRARPIPPASADRVEWTTFENRDKPATGTIYSNNVYDNAPPELKGKAKFLRILSIDHKTYTYWGKRNYVSSGPEISPIQSEGIKKIIGTVPIEEDGSVSFKAPSGIALHFQLLDENGLCLQTMKSFTGVLPGETRGCLGCHESMTRSPVTAQTGKALKRAPSNIKPVPWEDITVGYERYVQPVLDKHCGKCHQDPEHAAYKKFNATLRPGFLGFKEPYMTLIGNLTWARKYDEAKAEKVVAGVAGRGGFGWADVIPVEGYGTLDPAAYSTFPAMTKMSYKSRLVHRMMSGEHNGVKVTGDDLQRVILWVDAMAPYYGAEEVRCMEDPVFPGVDWISQRPRIMTAPIVQRPGPFDPFFKDSAYDAPDSVRFNALPVGVNR
jgi:hypothetical protein